ncbi:MAG: 30S ribosomal protein S17 [Puniceicoccales bacterium]|jgi:small subunit ribosomal protein S17|nr:30S ribosomal protein S17 [Puniceicoccales bacterium]
MENENKSRRNSRKFLVGSVIKKSGDKTIKVACFYKVPHAIYQKEVRRKTVIYAHDEDNKCGIGDSVRVFETRPLSRLKRWRVGSIISTAASAM